MAYLFAQKLIALFPQVVAYLFAQKLIAPDKFFMIRGNHEVRNIQENFTFKSECLDKFGSNMGAKVWEAINKCFDCLPLAAVIDDKVSICSPEYLILIP